MMRLRRYYAAWAGAISVCAALSACTSEPPADQRRGESEPVNAYEQLLADGLDEQAEIMEDGKVTSEEYMGLMESVRQCFNDHEAEATVVGWNPSDMRTIIWWFNVSMLDEASAREAEWRCLDDMTSVVPRVYLEQTKPTMDPGFKDQVVDCLEVEGYTLRGQVESHYDIEEQGVDRMDIGGCVQEVLQTWGVGYERSSGVTW